MWHLFWIKLIRVLSYINLAPFFLLLLLYQLFIWCLCECLLFNDSCDHHYLLSWIKFTYVKKETLAEVKETTFRFRETESRRGPEMRNLEETEELVWEGQESSRKKKGLQESSPSSSGSAPDSECPFHATSPFHSRFRITPDPDSSALLPDTTWRLTVSRAWFSLCITYLLSWSPPGLGMICFSNAYGK